MNWSKTQSAARHIVGLLVLTLAILAVPHRALAAAEVRYTNPNTGYQVMMDDDYDLLTDSEEEALVEDMKPITDYGNVAFNSVNYHASSYGSYAKDYLASIFHGTSSTVFVIDMQYRQLTVHSDGDIYKVVTTTRAETITDNIYRYASNGDYYSCASEAYSEIVTLMQGDEIAKPMKYVSNALLAILLALLINFVRVRRTARMKAAAVDAIIESAHVDMMYHAPNAVFLNETRAYDPLPRGGGGGFGGGGGQGGGGGGHSGGGGGSHGF